VSPSYVCVLYFPVPTLPPPVVRFLDFHKVWMDRLHGLMSAAWPGPAPLQVTYSTRILKTLMKKSYSRIGGSLKLAALCGRTVRIGLATKTGTGFMSALVTSANPVGL